MKTQSFCWDDEECYGPGWESYGQLVRMASICQYATSEGALGQRTVLEMLGEHQDGHQETPAQRRAEKNELNDEARNLKSRRP